MRRNGSEGRAAGLNAQVNPPNVEENSMDMDANPPVSRLKRAFFCVLFLLILGAIAAFAALTATNPKIPHPWGDVRLAHYSTNDSGTMAHFRFRNLFEWAVFVEVGVEVHSQRGWEMARGYSLFVPIDKPVPAKNTQSFSVPMPSEKEWRVLVRATKCELTKVEAHRERIKQWLDTHGAAFLGEQIEIDNPNGHLMPGPDMKIDKAGQLPTPYYASSLKLPAWDPFPNKKASYQRR